jgi:hypothetical protein
MLRRIAAKFIASPDSAGSLDLHPFIGIFHRFIQQGAVPGLLVDVADYAHVPDGPGVMLIGHDVDYGIDRSGGRAGLLTTRKRCADLPLAEVLRDTLQRALQAMAAIEADDATDLRFGTAAVTLQFIDRSIGWPLPTPMRPSNLSGERSRGSQTGSMVRAAPGSSASTQTILAGS